MLSWGTSRSREAGHAPLSSLPGQSHDASLSSGSSRTRRTVRTCRAVLSRIALVSGGAWRSCGASLSLSALCSVVSSQSVRSLFTRRSQGTRLSHRARRTRRTHSSGRTRVTIGAWWPLSSSSSFQSSHTDRARWSVSSCQALGSGGSSVTFLTRLSRLALHSGLTVWTRGTSKSNCTNGTRVSSCPRDAPGSERSHRSFGSWFTLFSTGPCRSGWSYWSRGASGSVVSRCSFRSFLSDGSPVSFGSRGSRDTSLSRHSL